jgi:serine/threonine protein kinase
MSDNTEIGTLQLHGNTYTLLEEIGRGGQGTVYRARDAEGNTVACKVLNTRPEEEIQHRLDFCRTPRQHVSHIIEHGLTTESNLPRYLIVSEFVGGKTLEDALKQGERFPQERALSVMEQLALALKQFHDDNLIHRDMKPSNAKIEDETVTLVDHGTVRSAAMGTLSGTMGFGSLRYAAPEQWSGQPTTQSDLYSLGVTMWELTTGNPAPLSYHIHADKKRFDFRIYGGLNYSADFVELIHSLTQHDAADRPTSIDDVLASIERIRGREVPTKETALVPVEEQPLVVPKIEFTEEMRERERKSLTTRKILNTVSYVSYGAMGFSCLVSGFSLPSLILGVGPVCVYSFLKRLYAGYANPKLQAYARIRELEKIKDTRLYALEAQKHLALTALDEHQLCRRQKKGLARVIEKLDDSIAGYLFMKAFDVMDEGERKALGDLETKIDFKRKDIPTFQRMGWAFSIPFTYTALAWAIAAGIGLIPSPVKFHLAMTEVGALITLGVYAKSIFGRKKLAKLEREKATLDDKLRHTPMHHTDEFSAEAVAHYNAFMRQVTEDVAILGENKRTYDYRISMSRNIIAISPDQFIPRLSPENAKIYYDLKSKAEGFQRRLDNFPFLLIPYTVAVAFPIAGGLSGNYVIGALGIGAAVFTALWEGLKISSKRKIRKIDEAALDLLVLERPDAELEEKIAEINALAPAENKVPLYLRVARYVIDKPIHAYYKRRLHAFEEGSYKRLAIIAMRDYTACIGEVRQAFQSNDAGLKRLAEEMLDSYETQGDFQATGAYRLRGLISPIADEIELKAMIHQSIPLHSEPERSQHKLGPKGITTLQ